MSSLLPDSHFSFSALSLSLSVCRSLSTTLSFLRGWLTNFAQKSVGVSPSMGTQVRQWLLLVVVAAMALHRVEVEATPPKNYVRIVSQLAAGMTAHCRSQDVDLQEQFVDAGRDYSFSFYLDTFGDAHYWCTFASAGHSAQFDVFTAHAGNTGPCAHCLWTVSPEGFYRKDDAGGAAGPVFVGPWH